MPNRLSYGSHLLRMWRDFKGLTFADAADSLGLWESQLSRFERGEMLPGRKTAVRIQVATDGMVAACAWDQPVPLTRAPIVTETTPAEFVYFIRAGKDGEIKIGKAVEPEVRLRALQSASARQLFLLAVEKGGVQQEADLHRRFAAHRLRGEWFAPADELLAYVASVSGNKVEPRPIEPVGCYCGESHPSCGAFQAQVVKRIVLLRKAKGWNQTEFARRCGFTLSKMNRFELSRSVIRLSDVDEMIDALGVDEVAFWESIPKRSAKAA